MTSRYIPQLSFFFCRHRAIELISLVARSPVMPACYLCGPLISGMGSLAICLSGFMILAKMSGFVIPCYSCFASASTRSSLATRTLIAYVTIRRFRFLPINRWVHLSDHNQLSAVGRTRPRLATSSTCRMPYSIGLGTPFILRRITGHHVRFSTLLGTIGVPSNYPYGAVHRALPLARNVPFI